SSLLTPGQALTGLTGIPSDPSALTVLETASGRLVLVTSQGEDNVFVFAFGPPGDPYLVEGPTPAFPAPVHPDNTAEASAPLDAPLALVVTLIAGNLSTGEGAAAGVLESAGGAPRGTATLAGAFVGFGGGDDAEEEEDSQPDALVSQGGDLTPALDEALRQLDLYRR